MLPSAFTRATCARVSAPGATTSACESSAIQALAVPGLGAGRHEHLRDRLRAARAFDLFVEVRDAGLRAEHLAPGAA